MREIRYEINESPYGTGPYLLIQDLLYQGRRGRSIQIIGTWRECAEKLRDLHPGAKLQCFHRHSREVNLSSNLGTGKEYLFPMLERK